MNPNSSQNINSSKNLINFQNNFSSKLSIKGDLKKENFSKVDFATFYDKSKIDLNTNEGASQACFGDGTIKESNRNDFNNNEYLDPNLNKNNINNNLNNLVNYNSNENFPTEIYTAELKSLETGFQLRNLHFDLQAFLGIKENFYIEKLLQLLKTLQLQKQNDEQNLVEKNVEIMNLQNIKKNLETKIDKLKAVEKNFDKKLADSDQKFKAKEEEFKRERILLTQQLQLERNEYSKLKMKHNHLLNDNKRSKDYEALSAKLAKLLQEKFGESKKAINYSNQNTFGITEKGKILRDFPSDQNTLNSFISYVSLVFNNANMKINSSKDNYISTSCEFSLNNSKDIVDISNRIAEIRLNAKNDLITTLDVLQNTILEINSEIAKMAEEKDRMLKLISKKIYGKFSLLDKFDENIIDHIVKNELINLSNAQDATKNKNYLLQNLKILKTLTKSIEEVLLFEPNFQEYLDEKLSKDDSKYTNEFLKIKDNGANGRKFEKILIESKAEVKQEEKDLSKENFQHFDALYSNSLKKVGKKNQEKNIQLLLAGFQKIFAKSKTDPTLKKLEKMLQIQMCGMNDKYSLSDILNENLADDKYESELNAMTENINYDNYNTNNNKNLNHNEIIFDDEKSYNKNPASKLALCQENNNVMFIEDSDKKTENQQLKSQCIQNKKDEPNKNELQLQYLTSPIQMKQKILFNFQTLVYLLIKDFENIMNLMKIFSEKELMDFIKEMIMQAEGITNIEEKATIYSCCEKLIFQMFSDAKNIIEKLRERKINTHNNILARYENDKSELDNLRKIQDEMKLCMNKFDTNVERFMSWNK